MLVLKLVLTFGFYSFYQWEGLRQEYRAAVALAEEYQAGIQADWYTKDGPGDTPRWGLGYFTRYGILYSPVIGVFLQDRDIDERAWNLLKQLRFLEFLSIYDCRVRDIEGLDFSHFAHLTYLEIANVPLTLCEVQALLRIPKLKDLCLYGTGGADEWLVPISRCADLESLWISGDITDKGVHSLVALKRLCALGLPKTLISSKACEVIARLPCLETLDLAHTAVNDVGMKHLGQLESLRVLRLCDTDISDKGVEYLSSLAKLEALYLDNTRITKASLPILSTMKSLNPDRVTFGGTAIEKDAVEQWYKAERDRKQKNEKEVPKQAQLNLSSRLYRSRRHGGFGTVRIDRSATFGAGHCQVQPGGGHDHGGQSPRV